MLIIGLPLALVLSWIYEITPEGLRREFQVAPERSITQQTGERLLRLRDQPARCAVTSLFM